MENCVFCKIIAGNIPATVVYEDSEVLAFITIEAISPGHTLVIPKQHISDAHKMDKNLYLKVMSVVHEISGAIDKAFSPKKIGLMISGWEIPHAHVHIVPSMQSHDVTSKKWIENTTISAEPATREAWAKDIKANL